MKNIKSEFLSKKQKRQRDYKPIPKHIRIKKLIAYNKVKEISKSTGLSIKCVLDNKPPKPIPKGLNKLDRIEDSGLFYRKGHKIKKLRSDLMENKDLLGIEPKYLAIHTNRVNKGINETLEDFKQYWENTPYKKAHLNLLHLK